MSTLAPAWPAAATAGRAGLRRAALPGVLAVATGLRLALLASPVGRLDGDEAAAGMAAQGILEGRYPLYFPDPLAYFGALEQYLQAPLLLADPTSPNLLRLPQVALSVASCWLVALVARRCLSHPWSGEIAAALFAVGPFFSLAWSFKARTYTAALFLALAGLALALGAGARDRRASLRAAALGLVCGLAFWTNWTSAFLLLPAALWWFGAVGRRRWALMPPAVAAFAVGAAPFLVVAARGRPPTFLDRVVTESTVAERAGALSRSVLGQFLGVRRPIPAGADTAVLPEPLPLVVVGVLLALVVVAAVRRRRGLLRLVTLRPGAAPGDALLLAALLAPVLYVLSQFAFLTEEPRYLYALYGLLPVGLAALVPHGPGGPVAAGVLVAVLALSTVDGTLATVRTDGLAGTSRSQAQSEDLPAVLAALEEEGVEAVWADYWLAHPLAFVARDRMVVASWEQPRFPEDFDAARAAPAPAYAARVGPQTDDLAAALDGAGATHRRRIVESVTLFLDVTPPVQPSRPALSVFDAGLTPVPRSR